jgi:hypothetical protein
VAADPEDLATLEAYGAAGRLHRHHSSVARRLAQPTGLLRAHLALTTWRLLNHLGRTASSPRHPYTGHARSRVRLC